MPELTSERLRLVPVSGAMKAATQRSRAAFAALIGVSLPEGWPEFPEAFNGEAVDPASAWTGYVFIRKDVPELAGNGGFATAPDQDGLVEIGYEIAPSLRGKGYATEAAQAMVDYAFANGARAVIAHSLAESNASNAVMRKLGMHFDAELEAEGMKLWRWRVDRAS
jgi:RimJ/RimL family protein N-acetyltransferase